MEPRVNYARLNNGKLEIHTDNATFFDGETHTTIGGKTFEINGEDLMKIYALLQDKEITCLYNCHDSSCNTVVSNYMIIGENVEKKRLMDMYIKLLYEVEEINKTRHWWERKIKINREI
jgi:hypothetical protein